MVNGIFSFVLFQSLLGFFADHEQEFTQYQIKTKPKPLPVQSADHRPNPRSFKPDLEVLSAAVRSLSFCPFGEGYMLVGSDDGSVRLHATTNERPLITWPGTVDGQPIVKLAWSTSRPCVFVVLDTASRIHLWDLGSGRN